MSLEHRSSNKCNQSLSLSNKPINQHHIFKWSRSAAQRILWWNNMWMCVCVQFSVFLCLCIFFRLFHLIVAHFIDCTRVLSTNVNCTQINRARIQSRARKQNGYNFSFHSPDMHFDVGIENWNAVIEWQRLFLSVSQLLYDAVAATRFFFCRSLLFRFIPITCGILHHCDRLWRFCIDLI